MPRTISLASEWKITFDQFFSAAATEVLMILLGLERLSFGFQAASVYAWTDRPSVFFHARFLQYVMIWLTSDVLREKELIYR